jgi:hypothetical protein
VSRPCRRSSSNTSRRARERVAIGCTALGPYG